MIDAKVNSMSENVEIHEVPVKKARKPYTKRPVSEIKAAIAVPQAPNPTIIALEAKIYELSEQRSQAQLAISHANRQVQSAQNQLRAAQEEFQRLEGEVQYRMSLIGQMRGGSPMPAAAFLPPSPQPSGNYYAGFPATSPTYAPAMPYPPYPPAFDPRMVPATGVGSAPAPNRGLYPDLAGGPDGELASSAQQQREDPEVREAFRQRGY
jgi:hypothetical protein